MHGAAHFVGVVILGPRKPSRQLQAARLDVDVARPLPN